jgi:hypothetical protein
VAANLFSVLQLRIQRNLRRHPYLLLLQRFLSLRRHHHYSAILNLSLKTRNHNKALACSEAKTHNNHKEVAYSATQQIQHKARALGLLGPSHPNKTQVTLLANQPSHNLRLAVAFLALR